MLDNVDPIRRAQQTNERSVAVLVLTTCALGSVIATWRILTVEAVAGLRILVVALAFGGYYVTILFERELVPWKRWLRTTLEVSGASAVMLIDAFAAPDFLVTSGTSVTYFLAVTVSCLRLDTRLSIYASVLAITQQLSIYLYVLLGRSGSLHLQGDAMSRPRLFQELAFRLGVLGVVGMLGFVLTRTLKKEIANAAAEERVRAAFGSYVDARVVKRVLQGDLKIEPQRRAITVLFVDIRNFTALTESSEPAQLFDMLNEVLDAFASAVQAEGGIVNKFLGDGLMAIFSAPEEQADHARRAVRASLRLAEIARERRESGRFPNLAIGIGLHTGDAIVGDVGGARREYTAIGDVVNVAARVEAMNKDFGTTILATRAVKDAVGPDVDARAMQAVTLRGRAAPVELFEIRQMLEGVLSKR